MVFVLSSAAAFSSSPTLLLAVIILLVPISNGTAFNWLFAGEAQLIEIQ